MATSDEILARELGKITTTVQYIYNPVLSGKPRDPALNLTAKMAASLPDDTYAEQWDINYPAVDFLKSAHAVLSKAGHITDQLDSGNIPTLSAIIPSGFWGLNPAIVSVSVEVTSPMMSHVTVTGVAKEGLIKQNAGKTAALKIISALPAK